MATLAIFHPRRIALGEIDLAKTKRKQWYRKAHPEGHAAA
jgi:hypothetical protein